MEHFRAVTICHVRPAYNSVCGLIVKFIGYIHRCLAFRVGILPNTTQDKYDNPGFYSFLENNPIRTRIIQSFPDDPKLFKSIFYMSFKDVREATPVDFIGTGEMHEPFDPAEYSTIGNCSTIDSADFVLTDNSANSSDNSSCEARDFCQDVPHDVGVLPSQNDENPIQVRAAGITMSTTFITGFDLMNRIRSRHSRSPSNHDIENAE